MQGVARLMLVSVTSAVCAAVHKEQSLGVWLEIACWYFRCQTSERKDL